MINKSYLDEFNSPIRQIKGRAEVLSISALSLYGKQIQIDNPIATEKIKVKVSSKNLCQTINTYSNVTINNGVITQITADTTSGWIKCTSFKNGTYVGVLGTGTKALGIQSVTFEKDDTFNQVCFGIGGIARDTLVRIDVSNLPNGTYTISGNFTNIEQGTISWKDMQIEKGSTATEYTPYMPIESGKGGLYFESVYGNEIGETHFENSGIYTVSYWFWGDSGELYIDFDDGSKISVTTNHLEIIPEELAVGTQLYYDADTDSLYYVATGLVGNTVTVSGKNVLDLDSYSATGYKDSISNNYGTTISTTEPINGITVTQTQHPNTSQEASYTNGFIYMLFNEPLEEDKEYTISFDIEVIENPLEINSLVLYFNSMYYFWSNSNNTAYEVGKKYRVTAKGTYKSNGTQKNFEIRIGGMSFVLSNIQIEKGSTASEYEPFQKPTVYTIDETLTIEAEPYIPTTIIYPNNDGIFIERAECSTLCLKDYFTHDGALKEIVIDRAGENGKFFGFGIGQKATIKLLDNERLLDITKDNYFKIDFRLNENDFVNTSPIYFVSETTRDETTNELTITALDYLDKMSIDTVDVLGLEDYTLRDFASKVAYYYSLVLDIQGIEDMSCFDAYYEEGANFDGGETIRNALNALAEVTQTIYYLSGNKLVFKRLNANAPSDLTIGKQHYFTLESKDPKVLGAIAHITELGDNVSSEHTDGEIQYIRNNPFWELRDNIGELIEQSMSNLSGLTITPFNCAWRGNFLLEPCDKIEIVTKDDESIVAYYINDKITYNGGYSQDTEWQYEKEQETATNPATIGETLKKTFARVDKVNNQIDLVTQLAQENSNQISGIAINLDSVKTFVEEEVDGVKKTAQTFLTKDEYQVLISEGIEGQNYSFKKDGLLFEDINPDTGKEVETKINNKGMTIYGGGNEKLVANDEGVKAEDLHATTYLIIGKNSRFEDYGNRTACFWIGG